MWKACKCVSDSASPMWSKTSFNTACMFGTVHHTVDNHKLPWIFSCTLRRQMWSCRIWKLAMGCLLHVRNWLPELSRSRTLEVRSTRYIIPNHRTNATTFWPELVDKCGSFDKLSMDCLGSLCGSGFTCHIDCVNATTVWPKLVDKCGSVDKLSMDYWLRVKNWLVLFRTRARS